MKLIFHYIRNHIVIFLISMFFLSVEAMADLMQPTFMARIVDNGVKNADVGEIFRYGTIMLLIAFCGAVGAVMRNLFASRTSRIIGKELRRDMYAKIQTFSFENIDRLQPASIITRITNDATQVQDFVNSCMRIMVKAPITCVGAIVLIVVQTPREIPLMLVIILISSLFIISNMRIGYPRFGKLQEKVDRLNEVSREFLSSVRVVKAFNAEEREERKFGAAADDLCDAGISAMRVMAVFSPLINLTVNAGIVFLLWTFRTDTGTGTGKLMASVNYMTQILFAAGMVTNILNTAVRAMASSRRIQEIMDEVPAQRQVKEAVCPDIKGEIAFEDVSFAYAGAGKKSLEHVSFHASAGETVGIIGPTGSGKTTLLNLVPRFYDAAEGRVLIDQVDVTEADERTVRNAVGFVPQKALLFTGTIRENLKWGDKNAADEKVRAAAEAACADEFIRGTERGYDTLLGQGGVNLSGGQKQRLSIARALIRNPKILILDDCTSALDAETETEVLRNLKKCSERMTVLLVSQRISTVMRADRILCLEDGTVKGYGTHAELLKNCGTYREIYASQIGGLQ